MLMKRMLWPAAVLFAIGLLLALGGCGGSGRKEPAPAVPAGEKIKVYTSIYPLFDFAKNIGGDRVEVINLLPPGADPHHWEPTPGDLIKISQCDVFVYCGAGLESWVESVLKNTGREKMVIVDCSRGIELLAGGGEHDGEKHGGKEHDGDHGGDPHIWLDPVNAGIMVDNILAGLAGADPAGKEYYTANAQNYKAGLAQLDGQYREALAGARVRQFVVSHAAFGYLARRYGLEQVPIRGLTAESEPGPARMAEIVDLVRKNGIKYIFFEPLASPRVSETIARETGAKTLILNPIAALTEKDINAGKNYLVLMRENLENLKTACEAR
ncbi:MAG: metal ABC transporter substrate-binding protein [Bacillota bacterium]